MTNSHYCLTGVNKRTSTKVGMVQRDPAGCRYERVKLMQRACSLALLHNSDPLSDPYQPSRRFNSLHQL